jgi:hypothetical protein
MSQTPEQQLPAAYFLEIRPTDSIPANFKRIATTLFNDWLIQVNHNFYRFLEIEFYYRSMNHQDVYTHGRPMQLTTGRWYFHEAGVDLTFGEQDIYSGILIRSIEKIKPKEAGPEPVYIHGPWNVLEELLHNLPSVFDTTATGLHLVPANDEIEKLPDEEIYSSYRHNISADKAGGAPFHKQHYRYLIYPKLGYKDKTGIAQSLLEQKGEGIQAYNEIKAIMGGELLGKERKAFIQKNSQTDQSI